MSFRIIPGLFVLSALAACQPAVPEDSFYGVGFDQTFDAQKARRDAELTGNLDGPVPVISGPISAAAPIEGSAEATAAETRRILAATDANAAAAAAAANSGVPPVNASPSNPPPPVVNASGISRENSFDAVSSQRSIESDAARLASNRAQYEVVQPEALPERGDAGPNIVAYALANRHPVGTALYKRFSLNKAGKYNRSCGQYRHQDQAQIDFLAAGGPERDPNGMDPDGDGYACTWDPAPYRAG